ncbi:MAG: tRNA pseudouridine(55) synthase TruB [Planctomycetota bacterium]
MAHRLATPGPNRHTFPPRRVDLTSSVPFGFLPCCKPVGMTSRDLVNHVQRQLRRETGLRRLKAGHTGTLDPLASGLIVVAIGPATRLTPWMLAHPKQYTGTFELGASSLSGDLEDGCRRHPELPLPDSEDAIRSAARGFTGWMDQTPPAHSAIRIDGTRAFDRVRRGERVEMPTRRVWIESVQLLSWQPPLMTIGVRCGSGTYLRALGMDLARSLGTTAVMTELVRTRIGAFAVDDAVGPEDFVTEKPTPENPEPILPSNLHQRLTSPAWALTHLRRRLCADNDARCVRNGIGIPGPVQPAPRPLPPDLARGSHGSSHETMADDVVALDSTDRLVAILRPKRSQWWPYRVFPESD